MSFNYLKTLLDNLYDGVYFVDLERRITYWNKGAEQITGFSCTEVVNANCSDNILMHVDNHGTLLCKEACPLAETIAKGVPRKAEIYLRHKDGHRIPVAIRVSPLYNDEGKIIGAVEVFTDNSSQVAALQRVKELEKLAYLDPVTELPNRRFTEINLRARFDEMWRYGWHFGVILIDIDNFKEVNETYGMEIGNKTLKMVAQTLVKNSRSFDVMGRWGGEEFLSIIVNIEKEQLGSIANRFKVLIEKSSLSVDGRYLQVTVSAGATIVRKNDTAVDLLKRVERLMYQSKASGKNTITLD